MIMYNYFNILCGYVLNMENRIPTNVGKMTTAIHTIVSMKV